MGFKTGFAMFYLYPIVYGVTILFGLNILCNQSIFAMLNLETLLNISKISTIITCFQKNFYLLLILIILTIIEVVRVLILNTKAVLLIEVILLFIYSLSIVIAIAYLGFIYICIKILQNFIPAQRTIKGIEIYTLKKANLRKFRGLMFLLLGLTILIHVLYSYFIPINIFSLFMYIGVLIIVNIAIFDMYKAIDSTPHIIILAIPPFGVIPAIQRIIMKRIEDTFIDMKLKIKI